MMLVDGIGYLAATLVLTASCMRRMVALRLVAIASNLAFIGYGVLAGIDPVLFLHVLLMPMNALRLAQAARQSAADRGPTAAAAGVPNRRRPGRCGGPGADHIARRSLPADGNQRRTTVKAPC